VRINVGGLALFDYSAACSSAAVFRQRPSPQLARIMHEGWRV